MHEKGLTWDQLRVLLPKTLMVDQSYGLQWSIRDFDLIVKKLIQRVNTNRLTPNDFHNYMARIYNDQTVVLDRITTLEPLQIARTVDRITFEGVRNIWNNWVGNYQEPMNVAAIGSGVGLSSYAQKSLFQEEARVPINTANNGFMSIRGETLFITASFDDGTPTHITSEFAVLDSTDSADDRMGLYVQFETVDLEPHTQNNDVPTQSTSATICTL
jgi:hypothetical protein